MRFRILLAISKYAEGHVTVIIFVEKIPLDHSSLPNSDDGNGKCHIEWKLKQHVPHKTTRKRSGARAATGHLAGLQHFVNEISREQKDETYRCTLKGKDNQADRIIQFEYFIH